MSLPGVPNWQLRILLYDLIFISVVSVDFLITSTQNIINTFTFEKLRNNFSPFYKSLNFVTSLKVI